MTVAAEASLVPTAEPGDPEPLTAGEIALATGPLRKLGARIVDESEMADSVRSIATVLRAIPERRSWPRLGVDEIRQQIERVALRENVSADGMRSIRSELALCSPGHDRGGTGIGPCLLQRIYRLVQQMNERYWEAQSGS